MSKKLFCLVSLFILIAGNILSQNPPHPNGGVVPGISNVPVGGGSPIGGGLLILLFLGLGYGMRKMYEIRSKSTDDLKF